MNGPVFAGNAEIKKTFTWALSWSLKYCRDPNADLRKLKYMRSTCVLAKQNGTTTPVVSISALIQPKSLPTQVETGRLKEGRTENLAE